MSSAMPTRTASAACNTEPRWAAEPWRTNIPETPTVTSRTPAAERASVSVRRWRPTSTQRARRALSAWRQTRATPAPTRTTGQRYSLAPPLRSTLPTKIMAMTTIASSATIWPLSGLRATSLRRPSVEVSVTRAGGRPVSTPPTPSGTKNQNAAYNKAPRPSAMNSPTKTSRTQTTGSPRCPASPRATPPSQRPSLLR